MNALNRQQMHPTDRAMLERVLSQCRERQSLECAEDQARQWHAAWLSMRAELQAVDSPAEWNW